MNNNYQKKIIIIDDNTDILEIIKLILDTEGYQVLAVNNGNNLISKITEFDPNLILLDVMLGDHDGREVCHEIKSKSHIRHIPIIMISATHDLRNMNLCEPEDVIAKPFDIQVLINKVDEQLTSQK